MKNIGMLLISLTIFNLAQAQAEKFNVNQDKSKVIWHAEKVTGSHNGEVKVKAGTLSYEAGKFKGGYFDIDMTSITCTDIEDKEYNTKLVQHLKSDDFFSTEKYPTAKLVITKVTHEGGSRYKVEGKLTIKATTKDVKFTAQVSQDKGIVTGSAVIVIDRSEFDVRFGSGSFFDDLGDKTIYDEFTIKISLIAEK